MKLEKAGECPSCGTHLNGAECIDEPTAIPSPGDWTICTNCATPLVFCEGNTYRRMNRDEFLAGPSEAQAVVVMTVAHIRRMLNLPPGFRVDELFGHEES